MITILIVVPASVKSLNLTNDLPLDAGSETKRALPIGFWKGSGLTIVLDMIAAALAGGQTTHEIQAQGAEYAVSQVRHKPFVIFNSMLLQSLHYA
jgi:LDH2 family malate/lactate/ureidoglycolate dehydrogenase